MPQEGFSFTYQGRRAWIDCRPTEGATVFSYNDEDAKWLQREEETIRIRLNATWSDQGPRTVRWSYKSKNDPEGITTLGVRDLTIFTHIRLAFEVESQECLTNDTFETLQAWVMECFDYFVDWYRLVANDGDVERPKGDGVESLDVYISDDYKVAPDIEGRFKHIKHITSVDGTATASLKKEMLPVGIAQTLVEQLEKGDEVPISQRLLMDSREYLLVHRQPEIAVILSVAGLEAHVKHWLTLLCKQRGIEQLILGRGQKKTTVPYMTAIDKGGLQDDLLRFVAEVTGSSIKSTAQYSSWKAKAYDIRNKLAHGSIRRITADVAKDAFEATAALASKINQVCVTV